MDTQDTTAIQNDPVLAARFQLVRLLGQGSAGSVYLVKDRSAPDKELALKILLNPEAFDEHTIHRFKEEIKVMQKIRHENLMEAYELIESKGIMAFTMEFVRGKDLGKLIANREFSESEIEAIFSQVLKGLQALHSHGVVHRDVKLENIMLSEDGRVKLTDLGLMKRPAEGGMTRTGVLLGTAQYMPPEYVRQSKFDNRGDLYAASIALFEILSKKRRLAEMNGMQAIEHLLKTKFELPWELIQRAPKRFQDVIKKATQVDPKRRYQSAPEMLLALQGKSARSSSGIRLRPTLQIYDYAALESSIASSKLKLWVFFCFVLVVAFVVACFFFN